MTRKEIILILLTVMACIAIALDDFLFITQVFIMFGIYLALVVGGFE